MAILDPRLDVGGATAPSGVFSTEALVEVYGTAAYRLPAIYDSSGNGYSFAGGGTDNTNPRVDITTAPHARRSLSFASAGAYVPEMLTPVGVTGAQFWGTSAKSVAMGLYIDSCVTNFTPAAGIQLNEGVICGNNASAGWGLFVRNNAGVYTLYAGNYTGGAWAACGLTLAVQTWYLVMMRHNGTTLWLDLYDMSGVRTQNSVATGATTSLAHRVALGRNAQAAPSYAKCRIVEMRMWSALISATQLPVVAGYYLSLIGNRGDAVAQAQDTAACDLWLRSQPRERIDAIRTTTRIDLLDHSLGDDLAIADDINCPTPDGGGCGSLAWERREMRAAEIEFDGDAMALTIRGPSLKGRLAGYVEDNGRAGACQVVGTPWQEGRLLLVPGGTRRAARRASYKWVERPTDGLVDRVPPDVEALTPWGVLYEGAARNHVPYSTMDNVGWTRVQDGAHGGSVTATATAGTGKALFAERVSATAQKWIHGSGVGKTEQTATPAGGAIATVGADFVFSLDWATTAPSYRIQRSSDGWYWNDATPGWQAASVDNLCSGTANASGIARHQSTSISDNGSNYTPTIVLPAAIADGAVCWVQHVQLETFIDEDVPVEVASRYATSRIVTTTAAATRSGEWTILSGDPIPVDHATLLCLVRPAWGSASTGGGRKLMVYSALDAAYANGYQLAFGLDNARMHLYVDGLPHNVTSALTFARDSWHVIGLRRTGAAAEHGTTDVYSTYWDGTKGTDVAAAAGAASIARVSLYCSSYRQSEGGAYGQLDAHVRRVWCSPRSLSDAEVAAISTSWIAQANAETPVA